MYSLRSVEVSKEREEREREGGGRREREREEERERERDPIMTYRLHMNKLLLVWTPNHDI